MGVPIKIDHNTFTASRGKFARFCVQIDLVSPILSSVEINGKIYKLAYENLLTLCYGCGRVGHQESDCTLAAVGTDHHREMEKANATEVENLVKEPLNTQKESDYGDWLIVRRPAGRRQNNNKKTSVEGQKPSNPFNVLAGNNAPLEDKRIFGQTTNPFTKNNVSNVQANVGPSNPKKRHLQPQKPLSEVKWENCIFGITEEKNTIR